MFNNEDDFLEWMDDDEASKIQREAQEKEAKAHKEYMRLQTLYVYFDSMESFSKDKFLFFEENQEKLDTMLEEFVKREEYEKCARIRDWIIRAKEIKAGGTINNAVEKRKRKRGSRGKGRRSITF